MKTLSIYLGILILFTANASQAATHASCTGSNKDSSYQQKATVHFDFSNNTQIEEIYLETETTNGSPWKFNLASATADYGYNPRSPMYFGMNRFRMASDGWSTTYLIIPRLDNISKTKFKAYIQESGHDSYPVIYLTCQILQ